MTGKTSIGKGQTATLAIIVIAVIFSFDKKEYYIRTNYPQKYKERKSGQGKYCKQCVDGESTRHRTISRKELVWYGNAYTASMFA
jgi:hypothetical protein